MQLKITDEAKRQLAMLGRPVALDYVAAIG